MLKKLYKRPRENLYIRKIHPFKQYISVCFWNCHVIWGEYYVEFIRSIVKNFESKGRRKKKRNSERKEREKRKKKGRGKSKREEMGEKEIEAKLGRRRKKGKGDDKTSKTNLNSQVTKYYEWKK